MDDLLFSPITELAAAIRSGRLSPVELTRAYLDRIAKLDATLRAFITVDGDSALAAARTLEREAAAGAWRGPLHGVPLAHKDLCLIAGLPTSCGTRTADYFVGAPPCTAVARLVAAGAITLGKLNMTELALGPFGDNAHHGDVQNPWRLGHVSGRLEQRLGGGGGRGPGRRRARHRHRRLDPAARGVLRRGRAQGHLRAGEPRGRHAAVLVLRSRGPARPHHPRRRAPAGPDRGPRSARRHVEPPGRAGLPGRARRPRQGCCAWAWPAASTKSTSTRRWRTRSRRRWPRSGTLGAVVEPVTVPDPRPLVAACSNPMVRAEGAAVHSRLLKERPGELQPAVRERLAPGLTVSAYEYLQGQRLRARFTREFLDSVFSRIDVLVTPTIPEPAPALADAKAGASADVIARMGRFSRLTRPFNALGVPALSVPCGATADGRPLAMQLVGRPFEEATLLRLGDAYERATAWHRRRPALP